MLVTVAAYPTIRTNCPRFDKYVKSSPLHCSSNTQKVIWFALVNMGFVVIFRIYGPFPAVQFSAVCSQLMIRAHLVVLLLTTMKPMNYSQA